ncbi:GyrI-like domain-containing protein [Clostridium sp. Marseille-QA1073]
MINKFDYKKVFKEFYSQPAKKVSILKMPKLKYLMINGHGNPNTSKEYKDAVETLFSLAYTIKFMIKNSDLKIDYGVMPLESVWWTDNINDFLIDNKDIWKWCSMIMQPDIVPEDYIEKALYEVERKKKLSSISKVEYKDHDEGLVAKIMHVGPYTNEDPTVEKLHNYIKECGYELRGLHHEIYLNDPKRCLPNNIKTIIRQPIMLKE